MSPRSEPKPLPRSVKLAALFFLIHAILSLVDAVVFGGSVAGLGTNEAWRRLVPAVVTTMLTLGLLRQERGGWIAGVGLGSLWLLSRVVQWVPSAQQSTSPGWTMLAAGLLFSGALGVEYLLSGSARAAFRDPSTSSDR
jgi:hypothetical protein